MALRSPTSILTTEQLDQMHAGAVRLLATVGLRIERDDIRTAISKRHGYRLSEGRILIDPQRIEAMRKPPLGFPVSDSIEAPWTCAIDDRMAWVAPPEGSDVRPMTRDDVVRGTKLIRALYARGMRGRTPGVPQDVPLKLQPLEQYLIAAEYALDGGGTSQVTDVWTAEVVRDMDRVYGRSFGGSVWCPSPLTLGGPELDILWRFRDECVWFMVGTMPSMGISGPCDYLGVYMLSIAECLGGVAVLSDLLPGRPWSIHPHPEPADLRSGAMTMGSPEWEILDLMTRDVFRYYGIDWDAKLLLTASCLPNGQAAAEKAASATSGMLGGFRSFSNVGQLACDEIYSPAQVLIDLEIVDHACRATRLPAAEFDADAWTRAIEEVVRGGLIFAEHETTAERMRSVYGRTGLFNRVPRGQWLANGAPSLAIEAEREAARLAETVEVDPPKEMKDLRRIVAKAMAA